MKKVLFVSPHPDDEVLGCAGTILKHKKEKCKIYWLIVTTIKNSKNWPISKINLRDKEILKVKNYFKFDKILNLNIETTKVDSLLNSEFTNILEKKIDLIKPNIIYLPFIADAHVDHKLTTSTFNTCIKSFRFPYIKKVYMYETLSETTHNYLDERNFKPNVFNDISEFIDKKIKAMEIYKSELGKHPFPRSIEAIKSLAILRGLQSNTKFAEAFELVLEIK
tara:strand:+ start:1500 stop:2165 length:666 start_codon:yes stop_codon:yes gene_type:complete